MWLDRLRQRLGEVDWWMRLHQYPDWVPFKGGKYIAVNWKMVLLMVCVWVGMFVFLPGGLIFE